VSDYEAVNSLSDRPDEAQRIDFNV
jgi:hypothetical protein